MAEISELREQLQELLLKVQANEMRQNQFEEKLEDLNDESNETLINTKAEEDLDIETEITSGDQIQLESYKSIPEFSGKKGQYRSWRNQVVRRMKMIHDFKTHPKYEAALGIVRAKITGAASNVLINNKTPYNIIAIIKTLDSSYQDRRPLYVAEAEMTSIKQFNKTLEEFHDVINEALHMVISKIVSDYKLEDEQKSLITEAQKKAVRTFTVGLNNQTMRHILYSRTPGSLSEAFAIAQTVHYDHQYTESQPKPIYSTNNNQNYNKRTQNSIPPQTINKTEAINDKKQENWRQQCTQQTYKTQRINQLREDVPIDEGAESDKESCNIPDDLISNLSQTHDETETSSAFLGE